MLPPLAEFLALDLAPLATAALCSIACAVAGNFLVLRRQSLLGDAISHSVLPGLAGAFLIAGSRDSLPMFLGALVAGVVAALLSDLLRRRARVESGAAMAVVFSAMFAAGVLAMSMPAMRRVDLDADCVLNGVLETILWTADAGAGTRVPATLADLFNLEVLAGAPRQLVVALVVCAAVIITIGAMFKEFRLASFDPNLAGALGLRPRLINTILVVLVAACSVASFEAVGSILVIAMLICPAVAARMLTDRLHTQIILSGILALLATVAGYFAGAFGPRLFGGDSAQSLSAAGMITVALGLLVGVCAVFAPMHGWLARAARRTRLALTIRREDLLAMLYRVEEADSARRLRESDAAAALGPGMLTRMALSTAARHGSITRDRGELALSDSGRAAARSLVRTHRLWETYLVDSLGLRPDHVHRAATSLEHITSPEIAAGLESVAYRGPADPHGRPIPPRAPRA